VIAYLQDAWVKQSFSASRQLAFIHDLDYWLNEGAAAGKSLDILALAAKRRKRFSEWRIANELKSVVGSGSELYTGMQKWFKHELVAMFRVGERSGQLHKLVKLQQSFWIQRNALVTHSARKLSYPVILLVVALIASVVIGQSILPRFLDLDNSMELEGQARLLNNVSYVVKITILPAAIALFLSCLLVSWLLPNWCSDSRKSFERFGVFDIYRAYSGVVLLQNLSVLLAGRTSLESACRQLCSSSTPYIQQHLREIRMGLAKGETDIARLLDTGLFSELTLFRFSMRIKFGQQAGVLFEQLATDIVAEVQEAIALRVRGGIITLYSMSVILIVLIILSMGSVFTSVAGQWT